MNIGNDYGSFWTNLEKETQNIGYPDLMVRAWKLDQDLSECSTRTS